MATAADIEAVSGRPPVVVVADVSTDAGRAALLSESVTFERSTYIDNFLRNQHDDLAKSKTELLEVARSIAPDDMTCVYVRQPRALLGITIAASLFQDTANAVLLPNAAIRRLQAQIGWQQGRPPPDRAWRAALDAEPDLTARVGVLHRVVDEVPEDLREAPPVALHGEAGTDVQRHLHLRTAVSDQPGAAGEVGVEHGNELPGHANQLLRQGYRFGG